MLGEFEDKHKKQDALKRFSMRQSSKSGQVHSEELTNEKETISHHQSPSIIDHMESYNPPPRRPADAEEHPQCEPSILW